MDVSARIVGGAPRLPAYNREVATWRVDFFDDWDDVAPSRSMVISANRDDEIVDEAESEMGDAVRLAFIPFIPPHRPSF